MSAEAEFRKALVDVRMELWVDECLRRNRTDLPEGDWAKRPVIRTIDQVLSRHPEPPTGGDGAINRVAFWLMVKEETGFDFVETADTIARLKERVAELEAEANSLSKQLWSLTENWP